MPDGCAPASPPPSAAKARGRCPLPLSGRPSCGQPWLRPAPALSLLQQVCAGLQIPVHAPPLRHPCQHCCRVALTLPLPPSVPTPPMADWADREAELRGEAADLEQRLRQAEGAAQALQSGAGDATRPLLRQIESIAAAAAQQQAVARETAAAAAAAARRAAAERWHR